jgi:tetratricopeptide (TPR) repeat protein
MTTKRAHDIEAQRHRALTPTDQLREKLDRLEVLVGVLGRGTRDEALQILPLMDETTTALQALKAKGGAVQAEEVRLKSYYAQLERKGAILLNAIGGAQALRNARSTARADTERWWWYLDEQVAAKRKAQMIRALRTAAIGAVILFIVILLYNQFLAPSPEVQARYEHLNNAEMLVSQGEYEDALSEIELGLQAVPNDSELLVLKGLLQLKIGYTAEAEATLLLARELIEDPVSYLLTRAQFNMRMYQPEAAKDDTEAALEIEPNSATAHYFMGIIAQELGNPQEAITYLEQAAMLASQEGNTQLEALCRVQISSILQANMAPQFPTESPQN